MRLVSWPWSSTNWPLLPHSHPSTSLIAIDDPQQSTSSCYQHSLPAVNIVMYQQSTPLCGQTTGARGRRVLTSPHSFMFHNKSFSNNDFLSCVVSVNTGYLHIYINNLPPSSTKIVTHIHVWAECLIGYLLHLCNKLSSVLHSPVTLIYSDWAIKRTSVEYTSLLELETKVIWRFPRFHNHGEGPYKDFLLDERLLALSHLRHY